MHPIKKHNFLTKWQAFIENPAWIWGLRVAFGISIPLLYGILSKNMAAGVWMSIAAESLVFIELKGNLSQRLRILFSGSLLTLFCCIIGSISGLYFLPTLIGMFVVGFACGMFKNLGEKGMALALSVYIGFIISASLPTKSFDALQGRILWLVMGCAWTTFVALIGTLIVKEGTPFRRSIGDIYVTLSALSKELSKGWDGLQKRSSIREVYLKEKEIRNALDSSFEFFGIIDNIPKDNRNTTEALAYVRRASSLIGNLLLQIHQETEHLEYKKLPTPTRIKIFSIYITISKLCDRFAHYIIHHKDEERLLIRAKINRLHKIAYQIKNNNEFKHESFYDSIYKIANYIERIATIMDKALASLKITEEKRIFKAYSFHEARDILHPKHIKSSWSIFTRLDQDTTKYALRIGLSLALAYCIQYYWFRDHGYWIGFTTIIVSQPYFSATLKKGLRRSFGTILGVIVGTIILLLPFSDYIQVLIVFISSLCIIYFLKTKYTIATFFITIQLVGMLGMEQHFDLNLMLYRALFTIIGSSLAIVAGFTLFPSWDKKRLPEFVAQSLVSNFQYFIFSVTENGLNWTHFMRKCEIDNVNAYESFTRYMQEPTQINRKNYALHYAIITHTIRNTRFLNSIHMDAEHASPRIKSDEAVIKLVQNIQEQYLNIFNQYKLRYPYIKAQMETIDIMEPLQSMRFNKEQIIYLEKIALEIKSIKVSLLNEK